MVSTFTRKDFLETLFGDYYRAHRGFILVKSVKQGDPKMSTRYFPNIEILAKEPYGEDRDVYFGICPRERMKPEKEHILYVSALWADMDIGPGGHTQGRSFFDGPESAAKVIRNFPRPPSIAVNSGRGLHLYWLLDAITPVSDPKRLERILDIVHERLQCGLANSLDTMMRLPDTLNNKVPDDIVRCRVTFINSNFRYSLTDFEDLESQSSCGPPPHVVADGISTKHASVSAPLPSPGHDGKGQAPAMPQPLPRGSKIQELSDTSLNEIPPPKVDQFLDHVVPFSDSLAYSNDQFHTESPLISEPSTLRSDIGTFQTAVEVERNGQIDKIAAARTVVEIALLGSNTVIHGIITWNENGLIGVEAGEVTYAIPLTSVSFIRFRSA